jgi:DNA-binding protein HU-beta
MTKAEIVSKISSEIGIEKENVLKIIDSFTFIVKNTLISGNDVTLRGFGTFVNKLRAKKIGRNISKDISVVIPAHCVPAFKPSKDFIESVKKHVPHPQIKS